MADFLRWWLTAEVVGLAALPLALTFLRPLPDRGISLARPLGLLLVGYAVWLAATGPVPGGRGTIAAASCVALWRRAPAILSDLRERAGYLLIIEALFLAALAGAAFLRAYVPEIQGTEKPMDFAFLNAAMRADGFPPADPWLSGHGVSYYYFGYLLVGVVAVLAGVPAAAAFNLGLALVFALAAVAAVGLGYNLVVASRGGGAGGRLSGAALAAGGVAAILLLVAGSLEGVLEWLAAHGYGSAALWERAGIEGLDGSQRATAWYPTEFWWWWRATRVIPGTIHEFPFFSFLLGDLHPHVMAIPFVLLAAGVALSLWLQPGRVTLQRVPREAGRYAAAALAVGALGFLNTWDLPVALFVLGGALVLRNLRERWDAASAAHAVGVAAAVGAAAVVLYAPFYTGFSSQAEGFALVREGATAPFGGALLWAPLLVPVAALAAYGLRTGRWPEADRPWMIGLAAGAAAAPVAVWGVLLLSGGGLVDAAAARGQAWIADLGLVALLGALVFGLLGHAKPRPDGDSDGGLPFALLLAATGVLLVLGPEFFYVRDVFGTRMNTVFKLWYHGWILLAAAGGYGAFTLLAAGGARRAAGRALEYGLAGAAALVLAGALVYPVTATFARTEGFSGPRTLDGLAFVRESRPDEAAALDWLRGLDGTPVVLEAAGPDWGDTGRVSSRTGLPTVLGWPGHELQWRGTDDLFRARGGDVTFIYESTDIVESMRIMDYYGVDYVYVGHVERQRYPAAGLAKFEGTLEAAFRQGDVVIYRVPD